MIDTPWADDRLNRKADGEHLIKVLKERYEARKAAGTASYILNIDASWGQGKTFFLENLAAQLRRDHIVGMVNAWQDDHANDPLITVMAAIEGALQPFLDKEPKAKSAFNKGKQALGIVAVEATKQMAYHAVKLTTGIGVAKIAEQVREATGTTTTTAKKEPAKDKDEDDSFDKSFEKVWDASLKTLVGERITQHKRTNDAIRIFREQTAEAIRYVDGKGLTAPMFVFIDELDRCRPTYAIKLLEDVKHLFQIDGIVFVVATDSDQLAHSVKAIYGAEFEARKYLRRFFDRVFVFPDASRRAFIESTFEAAGVSIADTFFSTGGIAPLTLILTWADSLKLSNRDIVQITDILSTFVTSFEHACEIEPNYLLALATAFYVGDSLLFRQVSGQGLPEKSVLEDWTIPYLAWDGNAGRQTRTGSGVRNALHMMTRTNSQSIEYFLRNENANFLSPYFHHEFEVKYGNRYPDGPMPFSVLSEYPSRVQNAGRVIDRK
jgi:hypothetical protein